MPCFRVTPLQRLILIVYEDFLYEAAPVEWFATDDGPDPVTGMWIVRPEMDGNTRVTSIVPLSSIARACHICPSLVLRIRHIACITHIVLTSQ